MLNAQEARRGEICSGLFWYEGEQLHFGLIEGMKSRSDLHQHINQLHRIFCSCPQMVPEP